MIYYLEFEKIDAEKIIDVFLVDLKSYIENNDLPDNESTKSNSFFFGFGI